MYFNTIALEFKIKSPSDFTGSKFVKQGNNIINCLLTVYYFFTFLKFFFKPSSFIWSFQSFVSWPIHLGRVLSMFQGRLSIPSLPFCFHMSDFQLGSTVKHSLSSPLVLSPWARCILTWHLGQGWGWCVATEGLNEEPYLFFCGTDIIWILFTSFL